MYPQNSHQNILRFFLKSHLREFYLRSSLFDQLLLPSRPPPTCTALRIRKARRRVTTRCISCADWSALLREELQVSAPFASALFALSDAYLARSVEDSAPFLFFLSFLSLLVLLMMRAFLFPILP